MIKFICVLVCLLAIRVQAGTEYLENIGLEKTQTLLSAAKSNPVSGTIYDKIYNEARKLTHLNGADSESLFLDLYFSACFLENKTTLGQTPENLTDDLYSQILRPLGSSVDVKLYSLELTGILSRVSGIFGKRYSQSDRSDLQSSFARLITGRGRFQLQEANVEQKTRLIMDIYRHYNLNDPKFNNDFGSDINSLWKEIIGKDFLVAKELSAQQVHDLNCFIIAYFASKSEKHRLAYDLRDVVGYLKNKVLIMDGSKRQNAEPMLQVLASYCYGIIAGQIEKQGSYAEPTLMGSFYETNLKQTTQHIAKINHQIRICKDGDVLPSLRDPYYDGGQWGASINVPHTLAHYLGYFSDQHSLMPYDTWKKMNKVLGLFVSDSQDIWNQINASLSKNPLREGLSSALDWRFYGARPYRETVDDPRYVKEETSSEAAEKRKVSEAKRQRDAKEYKKEWEERERYAAERPKRKAENRQKHEEQKRKYVSTLQDLPLDKNYKENTVEDWKQITLWNVISSLQYILDYHHAMTTMPDLELNIYEALDGTDFVTTEMARDGGEKIYSGFDQDEIRSTVDYLLNIFKSKDSEKYSKEINGLEIFLGITSRYTSNEFSFMRDDYWIRPDAARIS